VRQTALARRALLCTSAVAVLVVGAVVFANVLTPPTSGGRSSPEYLSTASGNFASQAVSWFPTWITLPPGYAMNTFAFGVAERLQAAGPGYLSRLGVEADFERYSRCLWMVDWMSAEVSNDLGGMSSAAVVLRKSATWPATVATASQSVLGLQRMARSAAELDLVPVSETYRTTCPALPPTADG
jgi:hypothetical protein